MNQKLYVPYQTPGDVDERILAFQERLARQRGLPLTKVSKSGDVMRYVLDLAELAESMGIQPQP